ASRKTDINSRTNAATRTTAPQYRGFRRDSMRQANDPATCAAFLIRGGLLERGRRSCYDGAGFPFPFLRRSIRHAPHCKLAVGEFAGAGGAAVTCRTGRRGGTGRAGEKEP